jgi:signal transduction histidine kinase
MASTQKNDVSLGRFVKIVAAPPASARALRYRGDDHAVPLSAMNDSDSAGVRGLYAILNQLDATLRASEDGTPEVASAIADAFDIDTALAFARTLGASAGLAYDVRQSLHDVRGGALTSLILEIQRARRRKATGGVRALRILTSDHLKVMRNAVLELDDVRRTADLMPTPHAIDRLQDTLMRVTGDGSKGLIEVDVQCSFSGIITMSCVELGALDRAALNLVNNAIRHASSGSVEIALLRADNGDLRICVANAIDPAHAAVLQARFGDSLDRMFLETFSTSGSGDGMKICVDFVSAAYGLVPREEVVTSHVVGAFIDDGWFVAWMHWPAVA